MTTIRTHKSTKYFSISNETAQDNNISFQALGLLTYCLSMPCEWVFHPKTIAKTRKIGRDVTYNLFNELIENLRCIRIREKHNGNLPGKVSYHIFCDAEDCLKMIDELEKNSDIYIEHGNKLKKSFRRPEFQDTESQEPENKDVIKDDVVINDIDLKKQQPIAPSAVVVFPCLDKLDILESLRIKISQEHSIEVIEKAIERCLNWKNRPDDSVGIITALNKKDEWCDNLSKEQKIEKDMSFLKILSKYYDGKTYKKTQITISTKYIEFVCGMKVVVYTVGDVDFKKKVSEYILYLGIPHKQEIGE